MTTKTWDVPVPEKGSGGGDYVLPPEGNHAAVCVAVIDLGTQRQLKYQTKTGEMEDVRKVYLVWELVDVEGNPLIGRDFKVSLHEKSGLRHFVDSWIGAQKDGSSYNLFALSGKPCLLNVKHHESREGKTFGRIEGATPLPKIKGKPMEISAPTHEAIALSIAERDQVRAWVPYLYGRSVKDWMSDAKECRRSQPAGKEGDDEYDPDDDAGDAREPEESIPY